MRYGGGMGLRAVYVLCGKFYEVLQKTFNTHQNQLLKQAGWYGATGRYGAVPGRVLTFPASGQPAIKSLKILGKSPINLYSLAVEAVGSNLAPGQKRQIGWLQLAVREY